MRAIAEAQRVVFRLAMEIELVRVGEYFLVPIGGCVGSDDTLARTNHLDLLTHVC